MRPWAGRLGLLLASLVSVLAVAEVGVRVLTDVQPPLKVRDAEIGQRYLRSFEAETFVPEAGRVVAHRFNREGFRGPDRPLRKEPGARRIAVLGDSLIAAMAVDERDTLVAILERSLQASHPESRWEVMNFGISGASPGQELALYRAVVWRYAPDLVLLAFYVGNDLTDASTRLSNNPRIYFDVDENGELVQLPGSDARTALSRFLNRYSRFYVWQKTAIAKLGARAGEVARQTTHSMHPSTRQYSRVPFEDFEHAWEITGAVLGVLRDEVEARGSRLAVVAIPEARQIYRNLFAQEVALAGDLAPQLDPDVPDERLRGICDALGIPFLTLTPRFRAESPSRDVTAVDEWLYLGGGGHLNERGNAVAADEIQRFVTALLGG
jgi:hypothetical protein